MWSRQIVRIAEYRTATRWFTCSNLKSEINKVDKTPVQRNVDTSKSSILGANLHRVSNFDKKILVWVKRYPSIADVPEHVTVDCMLSARTKARIKTCNYMIVGTLLGCIVAAIIGKKQIARGETLLKQRDDLFKEVMRENSK